MSLVSEQNEDLKRFYNEFKTLEKKIKEYENIVIYRHISPDFDALGSQCGLGFWIRKNFPEKKVFLVGERHRTMMPDLFPYPDEVEEVWYKNTPHLAITVDVADIKRVSADHLRYAREVIKIDHHPLPKIEDRFGDLVFVHPNRPALAEIIALFLLSRSKKYTFPLEAATFLYAGIVGDTGSFKYQDTDGITMRVAGSLLDLGVDQNEIAILMDRKDERQIRILQHCLNSYKTHNDIAYYIITKEDEERLDMTADEGNLFINMFRGMKGVKCAVSIAWNSAQDCYRVSIRSTRSKIAPVAKEFEGGGHDYAAGCKLRTLDQLPDLLKALDEIR